MTPWWQPILGWGGVVIAATIAGGIALRNARKTPHETLKTLVEILDKSEHIWRHDRHVLEAAVHREIQRIDRLNQARIEGRWAFIVERIKQIDSVTLGFDAALTAVGAAALVAFLSTFLG